MATQNGKNFVDSVLEAQKNLVENIVENTRKVTNGNNFINEAIDKGSDAYKNWIEQQKNAFGNVSEKAEHATEAAKENLNKVNEFNQNWLNNQINWAKQAWEMNQNFIKNNMPGADAFSSSNNPADWFKAMTGNWNNMTNWMNQANNNNQWASQWMNMMQQYNPANATDNWKKATESWTGMFNQYNEMLNNSFAEMQKNMQNATTKDAYSNMINVATGFGKFYEIFAPFWKSIQDKTFNAEQFKKAFNAEGYKDLMDKFFGFMPEQGRQYMQQATEWWNNGMKNVADMGKTNYGNSRDFFNTLNPFAGQNVFETMMNGYQNWQSTFQNAVSPIARMVTPNQFTRSAADWAEIADRMAIFNIKNAEMQYMVYQQGNKVVDELVANISAKVESGAEINSITALYQEWLNISDKVYVGLFESDEYSKLMAEVSALQLKLRKDVDQQAEKMLSGFPVATRSEMDELYKVIYDLKKEVRQLEKMLDIDGEEETTEEVKPARKTAAKK
jgi:polyhydroxyalkanoate synthesis regulator phasin